MVLLGIFVLCYAYDITLVSNLKQKNIFGIIFHRKSLIHRSLKYLFYLIVTRTMMYQYANGTFL